MRKYLAMISLLIVMVFTLALFSGCAEKKAVVKEEAVQEQQTAAAQEAAPVAVETKDDEAARRAKELADREAALKAQAERDAEARRAALAAKSVSLNLQNIYFDYDKSSIREDAREILKANADIFSKKADAGIIVEGHCDERGTAEYNMALGERRAQEAKRYLVNLGINASRIETISYGEERPLDNRSTEEAWAQNRRAQFLLK
ncbi:MAG TPA: peptidoglycan-associated lipoprotein Pal [Smithellaceae bacterium]|jgi:peptidoglycan-associated lipoprotein|nr:peptidoglycan-associated lipoprotein Pal [Smithellaceae bacterium]HQM44656.1 peptidoglycan-associated lipoprotein Pal [Smithellaceae bacterium]